MQRVATDNNDDQELVRKLWHSYELYDQPSWSRGFPIASACSDNGDAISMTTCPYLESLSIIKLHQTMEHKL